MKVNFETRQVDAGGPVSDRSSFYRTLDAADYYPTNFARVCLQSGKIQIYWRHAN